MISMTTAGIPTLIERVFPTLDAVVEYASKSVPTRNASRRTDAYFSSFAQSATFDDAVTLAHDGWMDLRADIDAKVSTIREDVASVTVNRIARRRAIAGGSVNVPRMLMGDPRCMTRNRIEPAPKNGRVVKVAINGCVSHAVSTDRIVKRGAAVVALVEAIHLAGCNAEVWVTFPNRVNGHLHHLKVCVKSAEQPLDVNALTFAIAHPGMLRRIVIGAWEQERAKIRAHFRFYDRKGHGCTARYDSGIDMSDWHVTVDTPLGMSERIEEDPAGWLRGELLGLGLMRGDAA